MIGNPGLKKYSHKVGGNFWHIVLVTKYRYRMFGKFEQKNLVQACLRKMAFKHRIRIRVMNVMPEHVHMLVTLPHKMDDSESMRILKGGSAYHFFKNAPRNRLRLPRGHLWSAGGCALTVGYNDIATVEKYIINQVDKGYPNL